MIAKNFSEINASDIHQLIEDKVPESKTLDYKSTINFEMDSDKRELLADVSSFANASGGDLLFGVSEGKDQNNKNTGVPQLTGLFGIANQDQTIQRLNNIIASENGIQPRIPGVQIRFIECRDGKFVCLVRIPKSWAGPHMVVYKTPASFYSRNSSGKQPIRDLHEIKSTLWAAESTNEKITSFRNDRLGRILAGDTPIKMEGGMQVVLHLLPLQSLTKTVSLNIDLVHNEVLAMPPLGINHANHVRHNFDGVLFASNTENLGASHSYSQVYRDGRIETVANYLASDDKLGKKLHHVDFAKQVAITLQKYLNFYRSHQVEAPIVLLLSIINAENLYIKADLHSFERSLNSNKEPQLVFPDVLIENFEEPIDVILKPIFDLVWNACGFGKCFLYNKDGRWLTS